MTRAPAAGFDRTSLLRLTLARACAWGLLVAGWIGLGTFALRGAGSIAWGFAIVALWLLALGAAASWSALSATAATPATAATAATAASRRPWPAATRGAALIACAVLTCGSLLALVRGGGTPALLAAVMGWAAITALASGVVRSVRLAHPVPPGPPIGAATLGALAAGIVLGDLGDLHALAARLAVFVAVAALALLLLLLLRPRAEPLPHGGCRAGLFDCSLPAWPAGAWRDVQQWPTLLAGLAMLPMMAALPLMADWCRSQAIAPAVVVLLHLAAMFVPALVLRHAIARWSLRMLSSVCVALLLAGAVLAWTTPAPVGLLALAAAHGAAWGLAWGGQLWAPARRAQQGTSPWRAAVGYAVLTLAFGAIVDRIGVAGVTDFHAGLAVLALLAWIAGIAARHRPTTNLR